MARRKKKNNNSATYVFIAICVLLLLVVVIAIAVKLGQNNPNPDVSESPTVSATAPTVSATAATPSSTAELPTPSESLEVTPVPSIQQATFEVPQDKIFAIHLTVNSGEEDLESFVQLFDDSFALTEPDDTDYTDVKLMVFITDYRGNSRISRFDNTDVTIRISKFMLDGVPTEAEALSQVAIRVDGAQNLHLTWAGQTVRIDAEGTGESGITAEYEGFSISISANPLGLMDKSDYQH